MKAGIGVVRTTLCILCWGAILLHSGKGAAVAGSAFPEVALPPASGVPAVSDSSLGMDQRWSVSPTFTYYLLPGGGLSKFLDQAFGVGAEISYRLYDPTTGTPRGVFRDNLSWLRRIRWLGDFSYIQMTPGATLDPSVSSSTNFSSSQNISPPSVGPIPGSASVTGFILRTGIGWDQPELTPEKWGFRRVIIPYFRLDAGMVDLAVSNVSSGLDGHPYGALLDVGAGIRLRIPEFPMGIFGEMDPTLIDAGGNIMTITPLVAGIMLRF